MNSKDVNELKEFLSKQGSPISNNRELQDVVNTIRAMDRKNYVYLEHYHTYFKVSHKEALYEFKAFNSIKSWHSAKNDDDIKWMTGRTMPSKTWIDEIKWDELYTVGTTITDTGVTISEKSWDKKTFEATAKSKKDAKQTVIDLYKQRLADLKHNPNAGDTIELEFKWALA